MAINYVGGASANANTVALPTHQFGDLILFCGYRDNNNFTDAIPSSYIQNTRNGGGGNGQIIAYKIAENSSESAPAFTNATQVIAAVYRSTSGKVLVANSGSTSSSNSLIVGYTAIAFSGSNIAEKWHAGIAGHKSNDTNLETAPTGMTNRVSQVGASAGHLVLHDSNAHQASWGGGVVSLSGTSNTWRSAVIEILELDAEYPTGSGGGAAFQLVGRGGLVY